eukprot:SAG11_NODE_306_length_10992_cov_46.270816_2_plen_76_part_00
MGCEAHPYLPGVVVVAVEIEGAAMYELVRVGPQRLVGEIIKLEVCWQLLIVHSPWSAVLCISFRRRYPDGFDRVR